MRVWVRTTGHQRKWSGNGERNGPSIDVYKSARTREASTRKTPFPRDFLSLSLSLPCRGYRTVDKEENWTIPFEGCIPREHSVSSNVEFTTRMLNVSRCSRHRYRVQLSPGEGEREWRSNCRGRHLDTHLDEIHNCWNNCSTREKARRFRSRNFFIEVRYCIAFLLRQIDYLERTNFTFAYFINSK